MNTLHCSLCSNPLNWR